MNHLLILALVVPMFFAMLGSATAQTGTAESKGCQAGPHKLVTTFDDPGWYAPQLADLRSPKTQFMAFGASSRYENAEKLGDKALKRRFVWNAALGMEPAIVVWRPENGIKKGCWGIAGFFSFGIFVFEDLSGPQSPLVNTDYIFGPVGKAAYGLTDRDELSFYFGSLHESSHIGDDYMVNTLSSHPEGLFRVNVSYEFWSLGAEWKRTYKKGSVSHRFSANVVANQKKGYYGETIYGIGEVAPTRRNHELAYGLSFEPAKDRGWKPFVSYEARLKPVFHFAKQPGQYESAQISQSLVLGLKDTTHRRRPELLFHFYYGVNPNGQLRKQNDFLTVAVGFHFKVF